MKITYNNKEYELDVNRSLDLGVLKPIPEPLQLGDVFVCPRGNTNNFLLVECLYNPPYTSDSQPRRYQLLGMGCKVNSGVFFEDRLHTLEEIHEYLARYKMVKKGNIQAQVSKLVSSFM